MGATIVESRFHHFSPLGVSGVVIIMESHLTIHTWPEYEYAAVDIPMLPVTHGPTFTRWHIFFYTVLLVIVTTLTFLTGMSGVFYLAGVTVLNLGFLWYALRLLRDQDERLPMQTFGYSVIYLMVLFIFLLVDHYLLMFLR